MEYDKPVEPGAYQDGPPVELTPEEAIKLAEESTSEEDFLAKVTQTTKPKSVVKSTCCVCGKPSITLIKAYPVCAVHVAWSVAKIQEAITCPPAAPVALPSSDTTKSGIADEAKQDSSTLSPSDALAVVDDVEGLENVEATEEAANPTEKGDPEWSESFRKIFNETMLLMEQKDSLEFASQRLGELQEMLEAIRVQQSGIRVWKEERLKKASKAEIERMKAKDVEIEKRAKSRQVQAEAKPKTRVSQAKTPKAQRERLIMAWTVMGYDEQQIQDKLKEHGME